VCSGVQYYVQRIRNITKPVDRAGLTSATTCKGSGELLQHVWMWEARRVIQSYCSHGKGEEERRASEIHGNYSWEHRTGKDPADYCIRRLLDFILFSLVAQSHCG
jgi:hypothetical protein